MSWVWSETLGYVYFAQGEDGLIKIGFTRDMMGRLVGLNNSGHGKVTFIGALPGNPGLEAQYHRRYARSRVNGEWFKPSAAILREARKHARNPEEMQIFGVWGKRLTRVTLKIENSLLQSIREDIADEGGRNFERQINWMLQKCLENGLHLERDRMVRGDLYGKEKPEVFMSAISLKSAADEPEAEKGKAA